MPKTSMMNKISTFPTETGSNPCMHGSSHSPGLNAPSSHSPSSPVKWGRCTGGSSRPPGASKTGREVGCECKAVHRASREGWLNTVSEGLLRESQSLFLALASYERLPFSKGSALFSLKTITVDKQVCYLLT